MGQAVRSAGCARLRSSLQFRAWRLTGDFPVYHHYQVTLRLARQRGVQAADTATGPPENALRGMIGSVTAGSAKRKDTLMQEDRARGGDGLPPMIEQHVTPTARHWVALRVRAGVTQKPWLEMTGQERQQVESIVNQVFYAQKMAIADTFDSPDPARADGNSASV